MLVTDTDWDLIHTSESTRGLDATTLIQRAVRMAAAAAGLPAIATLDWCESAARVLAGLDPGATAGVLVGQITDPGEIRGFEAAGVGCHADMSTSSAMQGALPELRWRLESINSLGWRPDAAREVDGVRGGRLSMLLPANWRESTSGVVWSTLQPTDIFVGTVSVAGDVRERRLAAWVAIRRESKAQPELGDVFLAILKQIGEAATRAIGQQKPGRSIWITPKEQEVLNRLILGYSVREIAAELGRSPHTMHDHVKSLHRKLGATSRGDLIARALGYRRAPSGPTSIAVPSPFELTEVRLGPSASAPTIYRPKA